MHGTDYLEPVARVLVFHQLHIYLEPMIPRKYVLLVFALLVLQLLGPLLHAHFSGPSVPGQTGIHLHTEEFPEFSDGARLGYPDPSLNHDHLIKTVTLQQAFSERGGFTVPFWLVLLPIFLLLLALQLQGLAAKPIPPLFLLRPQRYPTAHSPRAPPLA